MKNMLDYCAQFIPFSEADKKVMTSNFELRTLNRKEFLLKEGSICNFIAYVNTGIIRHYHLKDGLELTCDITFSNSFITDFKSFNQNIPSNYNFQILKEAELYLITKEKLKQLYAINKTIERFGRIMAEQLASRMTDLALSLASEKPEERVIKLLKEHPRLFQEVPQRYIANMIGITPESLSRIRSRLKP